MSSRNVYLSEGERRGAPELFRAMKETAAPLRAGNNLAAVVAAGEGIIERAISDYF